MKIGHASVVERWVGRIRIWPSGVSGRTWQVQRPYGATVWLSVVVLGLCYLLGEAVFGLDAVQARVAAPSLGSRHRQFEIQLARLDRWVKTSGPVDCILLGDSLVWLDINPQTVSQVFARTAGQPLRCFNFGISALPTSSAGVIASVLVSRYQPRLLVYGTFARDYAIPQNAEDARAITDTPWLRHQTGQFDLSGWLYAHSNTLRYRTRLREFAAMAFADALEDDYGPQEYQALGFDPKLDTRLDVRQPPDLAAPLHRDTVQWLYAYQIRPENLTGLRHIAGEARSGVRVVVLEMPVHPNGLAFFAHGERDYQVYLAAVEETLTSSGVPFWRTSGAPRVPPDGWWDYFHMNIDGAERFSTWLGEQLAAELDDAGE